jgi:hypothetical protein
MRKKMTRPEQPVAISSVQIASVSISAAQLLTMSVAPVTLIAAHGVGNIVVPVFIAGAFKFGTAPYQGVNSPIVSYGSFNGPRVTAPGRVDSSYNALPAFFMAGSDQYVFPTLIGDAGIGVETNLPNVANQPIVLSDDSVWTVGDGTASFVIGYIVFTP